MKKLVEEREPDTEVSNDASKELKCLLVDSDSCDMFGTDMIEMSRATHIKVPCFTKQNSPFKLPKKKQLANSFIKSVNSEDKMTDLRWMIVENFKGSSQQTKIRDFIPCLFLRNSTKTNKILIYFHGNSEDLGGAYQFLKYLQYRVEAHIIAVEYPGYGVYEGESCEANVIEDSTRVLEFVHKVLRWRVNDVIVIGRSIGTGPAWYLASENNIGALWLISPYTSIRAIVKNMFGKLSQFFIKEQFKNSELMEKVVWPTFILHGKKDTLIPWEQSEELALLWKGPARLVIPSEMSHCDIKYNDDFLKPFHKFLVDFKIIQKEDRQFLATHHLSARNHKSKADLDKLPSDLLKELRRSDFRLDWQESDSSSLSVDKKIRMTVNPHDLAYANEAAKSFEFLDSDFEDGIESNHFENTNVRIRKYSYEKKRNNFFNQ